MAAVPAIFTGENGPNIHAWINDISTSPIFLINAFPENVRVQFAFSRLSPDVRACIRRLESPLTKLTERQWVWNWERLQVALTKIQDQVDHGGVSAEDIAMSVAKIAVVTSVACIAVPAVLTIGLGAIGFGALGPISGSLAAAIQSSVYGGAVTSGSLFAFCQSFAMGGAATTALVTGASAFGGVTIASIKEMVDSPSTTWSDGENFNPSITVLEALYMLA